MKKLTRDEWNALLTDADASMKRSDGHAFFTALKTRCMRCGRSPRQKGRCAGWLNTFMVAVEAGLRDRGFFEDGAP